jgi:hypothetical protein
MVHYDVHGRQQGAELVQRAQLQEGAPDEGRCPLVRNALLLLLVVLIKGLQSMHGTGS